jgi:hypothetical protein
MDREGALPDRCVACNAPAGGYRMRRKLYSSPLAWKIGAFAAPFVSLFVGVAVDSDWLMLAFWPLAILAAIAHLFIRRALRLEFGVCARHRRLRYALIALSVACMAGVFIGIFGFRAFPGAPLVLLGSLVGLLVLVVAQSYAGAQALALRGVSDEHAWLAGTGEPFRSALPELN